MVYVANRPDGPENLTLHILQELRDNVREIRKAQDNTDHKLSDLVQRVDGNTIVFNLVAGVTHDHEGRLKGLETR